MAYNRHHVDCYLSLKTYSIKVQSRFFLKEDLSQKSAIQVLLKKKTYHKKVQSRFFSKEHVLRKTPVAINVEYLLWCNAYAHFLNVPITDNYFLQCQYKLATKWGLYAWAISFGSKLVHTSCTVCSLFAQMISRVG